jgi:PPOX class probable F420-dependent enzyme
VRSGQAEIRTQLLCSSAASYEAAGAERSGDQRDSVPRPPRRAAQRRPGPGQAHPSVQRPGYRPARRVTSALRSWGDNDETHLSSAAGRTRDDETILLYSRPEKDKLRNIAANPKVSFALDVTDIGRNIVRLEGTARRARDQPPANEHPAYLVKYTERLGALFGTPEQFAALFSAALIITPARLHT